MPRLWSVRSAPTSIANSSCGPVLVSMPRDGTQELRGGLARSDEQDDALRPRAEVSGADPEVHLAQHQHHVCSVPPTPLERVALGGTSARAEATSESGPSDVGGAPPERRRAGPRAGCRRANLCVVRSTRNTSSPGLLQQPAGRRRTMAAKDRSPTPSRARCSFGPRLSGSADRRPVASTSRFRRRPRRSPGMRPRTLPALKLTGRPSAVATSSRRRRLLEMSAWAKTTAPPTAAPRISPRHHAQRDPSSSPCRHAAAARSPGSRPPASRPGWWWTEWSVAGSRSAELSCDCLGSTSVASWPLPLAVAAL